MVNQCCSRVCSRWDYNEVIDRKKSPILPEIVRAEANCEYVESKGRWGEFVFSWRGDRFHYVRDQYTCDIYNDDSISLVWCKCALLIPKTVLCTLAKVVSNIAQEKFFNALRAIYYGTYCLGAALFGLVDPYEGRRLYSAYERAYFRDEDLVDRRNNTYMALCFVPINYNAIDKTCWESNIQILTRSALRHKYGV